MDTSVPTAVAGDHLFIVTQAKSYIDGHGFRLNPNLGFPEVQDYLYFPSFDFTQRAFLWIAARFTTNPFRVVFAYYFAGILAMYGAAIWALRWLGVRRSLAAVLAVAFVVQPYFITRAFGHDYLALIYAVPFGLALALKLGTAPVSVSGFLRQPFVIVALFVAASSGVYYAFFTMAFLGFSTVAGAVSLRRWSTLWTGLACIAVAFVVMVLSGYGIDLPRLMGGHYAPPQRAAYEQLMYGLDMPSLGFALKVGKHVADGMTDAVTTNPVLFANEGGGEWPGWFLTLVLLATPLIVACTALVRRPAGVDDRAPGPDLADDWRMRLLGFAALLAVFGLFYAMRGGLGFLFSLFVNPSIRATARMVPFLTFACLVVLAMVVELMSDSPRRWLRIGVPVVIALALLVSMKPMLFGLAKSQMARYQAPIQAQMRASLPPLLKAKDRIGAKTVLELPVFYWPEYPAPPTVDIYVAQLPYIYDKPHSATRWSFGAGQAQGNFNLRQFTLQQAEGLPGRARAYGYDSILIMKHDYLDGEPAFSAAMAKQFDPACRAYDDATYTLYSLSRGPGGKLCGSGA